MKDLKQTILELNNKLIEYSKMYYKNNQSIISDQEYDGLYITYKKLVQGNPSLEPEDSILKQVGYRTSNKFQKVKHQYPMLSLSNAFSKKDVLKFNKRILDALHFDGEIEYVTEPKIDGLSISLIYKNGKLWKGVTRGDGIVGEDVTHNILKIKDIPHTIDYKSEIDFRGEIYMPINVFNKLNDEGEKFANPRNAASGTLRQLDSSVAEKRNLKSFIYNIPNPIEHGIKTHFDELEFIKKMGLQVNHLSTFNKSINEALSSIDLISAQRDNLAYEIDGIVLKVNDINKYEDIGYTVKFPKYMTAFKFPEEVGETKLLKIFPTVGRTGRITYNAMLSPLRIAGTVVSAATLHNADYVKMRNINVDDIVEIKKAGEIIPRVLKVKQKNNNEPWEESKICPSCHSKLVRHAGEVDQYCVNDSCEAKEISKLEHFVSRNAMNIEGLSVELLKVFKSENFITTSASIFNIKSHYNDILSLKGFKEKSVNNIFNAIEKAKNPSLNKFMFALGIRHIGSKNSSILAKRFGTLEKIMNATIEEIEEIRDLGPKAASSLIDYFKNESNIKQINLMKEYGLNIQEVKGPSSNKFKGMTFAITGALSKPRDAFKKMIEQNNGNVSTSISSKTDYLLIGDSPGLKYAKAIKENVKIIKENDFLNLIKG